MDIVIFEKMKTEVLLRLYFELGENDPLSPRFAGAYKTTTIHDRASLQHKTIELMLRLVAAKTVGGFAAVYALSRDGFHLAHAMVEMEDDLGLSGLVNLTPRGPKLTKWRGRNRKVLLLTDCIGLDTEPMIEEATAYVHRQKDSVVCTAAFVDRRPTHERPMYLGGHQIVTVTTTDEIVDIFSNPIPALFQEMQGAHILAAMRNSVH